MRGSHLPVSVINPFDELTCVLEWKTRIHRFNSIQRLVIVCLVANDWSVENKSLLVGLSASSQFYSVITLLGPGLKTYQTMRIMQAFQRVLSLFSIHFAF